MKTKILILLSMITIGAGVTRSAAARECDSAACKVLSAQGSGNLFNAMMLAKGFSAAQAESVYLAGPTFSVDHPTYGSIGAMRSIRNLRIFDERCFLTLMVDDISYFMEAGKIQMRIQPKLMCGRNSVSLGSAYGSPESLGL